MKKEVKELEKVMERIAHLCFLEDKLNQFKKNNIEVSKLDNYIVKMFISKFINREDIEVQKLIVRITVNATDCSFTTTYENSTYLPIILKRYINPTETWQQYSFTYSATDELTLYDAPSYLNQHLGVEEDDD